MSQVDLSIVIVNFNTFELTCACIDSIRLSQTKYGYEIILVDNASTECKATAFLDNYPDLILIENEQNEGFGRANNRGMKRANGAYFLLLNSDTEVGEQVLEKAMNGLLEHQADLYSCAQELANGSPLFYRQKSFDWGHSLKAVWYGLPLFDRAYFRQRYIDQSEVTAVIEAKTISGAFMLLRRQVFETTKGFDPDFFLYSEETEWCYNRIQPFFKIIYDPFNSFVHKQGASSNQDMSLQQYVSSSLGYYKRGYGVYVVYLLLQYLIALPMNGVFYCLTKKAYKKAYADKANVLLQGCWYLLFDIPRFSNKFGARKKFLVIRQINV